MIDWNEELIGKLQKYRDFDLDLQSISLSVKCHNPSSFLVSITQMEDEFQVDFDGWHEHFTSFSDASNCFVFGLSPEARLAVTFRGRMECAWTLQSREEGEWLDDSTTGLLLFPFWR
ncbi:MAG: hypothetical protein AAFT19_03855, partial [Pseudomonadota bacterium]